MTRYFSDKSTAEKYAKRYGGKVSKCILLHEDGSPILDAGEHIEVWKYVKGKESNVDIGFKVQEV